MTRIVKAALAVALVEIIVLVCAFYLRVTSKDVHRPQGSKAELRLVASPVVRTNRVSWRTGSMVLASANDDGSVKIWDVSRGRLLQELAGFGRPVKSAEFSPDGTTLAIVTGEDGPLELLDPAVDNTRLTLKSPVWGLEHVVFSPNGRLVAAAGKAGTACLFNVKSGQVVRVLEDGPLDLAALAFSPDSRFLLAPGAGGDGRIWQVESGRPWREFVGFDLGTSDQSPSRAMVG